MYNAKKAAQYWGKRIKNFDLETAVLSLSFPPYLNNAYAKWETNTLSNEIGSVKNKTILDIGCGGGRHSIPIAKMGANVTGVDISPQMLAYARKNAKKNRCTKNTNFINSSAWDTGLPSKSFDKVLLLGILEHLPEEYRKLTIKETKRLLKKNGRLYVVINNKNSFFLKSVQKWKKPKQKLSGYYSGLINPKHIISYMESLKFHTVSIQSNLHYSMLLHSIEKIKPTLVSKHDSELIDKFFTNLIKLDIKSKVSGFSKNQFTLEEKFADQFFIILKT